MPNDYKLTLISWIDAETCGDSGWIKLDEAIEEANTPPPVMKSVGWVLYQDDKYVAVTSDLGPEDCGQITKIPIPMVINIEYINK